MILRTLSMPRSHTFMHSFWTSIILPWKFSWSNSMICREERVRNTLTHTHTHSHTPTVHVEVWIRTAQEENQSSDKPGFMVSSSR